MGLAHSPKIVTDGLAFIYDTGSGKSYKGEPTTNLYGNWNTYTGGSHEVLDNNTNYIKLLASAGVPWAGQFTAAVSAGTYTVSFQHRTDDGGSSTFNIDNDTQDDNLWNANITTTIEWQTYTSTKTHTGTGNHLLYFRRNGGTGNIYIRNVQLELKSHATPFIKGTRSATQGLLDLTRNSSIDISPTSFNSNAEIEYDGSSDYIYVAGKTWLFSTGATVEQIIRPNTVSRNQGFFTLNGSPGYINFWMPSSNTMRWEVIGTTAQGYSTISSTTVFQTNQYYHVVGTFNGTTTNIYINGVEENGQTMTNQPTSVTAQMEIGRYDTSYPSSAQIPVTKVYNKALSAEEVKNHFNGIRSRFGI